MVGRNSRNNFNDIKEKLDKKLVGSKKKLLSKASKEVLIKVVVQAIPTYTMSYFKILDTFCDELTSVIQNFWWGQKQGRGFPTILASTANMYCTSTCTRTETPMFCTGLNTGHTCHVLGVPTDFECFSRYRAY